jgi:hypothetical protein
MRTNSWIWHVATWLFAATTCACADPNMATVIDDAKATAALNEHLKDGSYRDTFLFDEFMTRAAVDVLIIDDNSDSMRNKQLKLGARLDSFLGSIGKIDWQIGITTTDTSDGTYGLRGSLLPFEGTTTRVLTKDTPFYMSAFNNTIVRKETLNCGNDCPSTDERGLRATIQAIGKRDDVNAGFFRSGADLAVIILSDEDEASTGGTDATQPQEVIDACHGAFGNEKNLTGFGLIIAPGDTKCFSSEATVGAHYGATLANFVAQTGGVDGSICDADYGAALASIGKRVREGIKTAILTALPIDGSLTIEVTPPDATLTWTREGRRITFVHPPKPGSQVVAVYQPQP